MLLSSVNFVAKPRAGKTKEKNEKKGDKKIEDVQSDISPVCQKCIEEVGVFSFLKLYLIAV